MPHGSTNDRHPGEWTWIDERIAEAHADHAISTVRLFLALYDKGQASKGDLLAAINTAGGDAIRAHMRGWDFLEEKAS